MAFRNIKSSLKKNIENKLNIKIQRKKHSGRKYAQQNRVPIVSGVVDQILEFYKQIPPFYFDDTRSELKIGGAWKSDLMARRKNQIQAIQTNSKSSYTELLEGLFANEMITGLWNYGYFNSDLIHKPLNDVFDKSLSAFSYITGRSLENLCDVPFGEAWGLQTAAGVIKHNDAEHGLQAFRIICSLNTLKHRQNQATVLDLGSGYGGMAIKLARWSEMPLRIIFVDIPLNLTTAFANVSMNFPGLSKKLVSEVGQLKQLHEPSSLNETEFWFVPSLFVPELNGCNIDVLHNAGSLSEMDYPTVEFYLTNLLTPQCLCFIETNSNTKSLNVDHYEVPSSAFPIPNTHSLFGCFPNWEGVEMQRYLTRVYLRRD